MSRKQICQKCTNKITNKSPGIQCCGDCRSFFHASCAGLASTDLKLLTIEGLSWACIKCRPQTKPAYIIGDITEDCGSASNSNQYDTLFNMLTNIQGNLKTLQDDFRKIEESTNFCSNKVTDFELILSGLQENFKCTQALKQENQDLKAELNAQSIRISELEQRSRLDNLEIQGIPEQKDEDMYSTLDTVFKSLDCGVDISDVNVAHRVQHVNNFNKSRPRNIVVKLNTRRKKHDVLAAVKLLKKNNLNNEHPGLPIKELNCNIFINEHLTAQNKLLLKSTRTFAKEKNFKYAWVSNCQIFLRKSDRSPVKIIRAQSDLDEF